MRKSDFPYAVEIAAHVRGQQAMYDFHARQGIRAQPRQGKQGGRRYMRWRFASLTDAEKFARQFGGSVVTGRYRQQGRTLRRDGPRPRSRPRQFDLLFVDL